MIGERLGHFRIVEEIGSGGMGVVYRAQDEQLGRDVAIKVLSPRIFLDETARKYFRKEALALSKLNHPNIETIHEFHSEDLVDFLVMEYIPGITLSEKLVSGPLAEKEILRLGTQLADGLTAAHQQGVLHRDLKPGNLRITPDGRLKILDFGLARLVPASVETATTSSVQDSGIVTGTLPYAAPEQLLGQSVDERTDIYSAGAALYEIATGRRPFSETQVPRLIDSILHQTPEPPTAVNHKISTALENIILKALDKDPDHRYQSARELRVDLERLAMPSTDSATYYTRRRFHRWKRVGLAGTLMVALAVLAMLLPQVRESVSHWLGRQVLPSEKHMVVLPFTNIGADQSNQAFCDGLVETLTSKLTQVGQFHGSLWVVPMSEIRRDEVASVREARKAFGVTLVVTGSVQRRGESVQLTANLVDARSLRQLRAITIQTRILDAAVLQDGIVQQVADMLDLDLGPEARRVLSAGDTLVGPAFDAYLQGRGYLQRYEKAENLDAAIGMFRRALTHDPKYALAYAGLGMAFWYKYDLTKDSQWVAQARENCQRAVKLNDQLAPVHITLGVIQTGTGKYEDAIAEFQRALELDPSSPDAYRGLAGAYEAIAEPDRAESTYKRAIELQPGVWIGYNLLGSFYFNSARYEEATRMFEQVVRLVPDSFRGLSNLAGTYLMRGEYIEAIPILEKSIRIRPTYDGYWNLGYAYFMLRRFAEAAVMYEQAIKLGETQQYFLLGNLGDAYSWSPGQQLPLARLMRIRAGIFPMAT